MKHQKIKDFILYKEQILYGNTDCGVKAVS